MTGLSAVMAADRRANANPRIVLLLTLFRVAAAARGSGPRPRPAALPVLALYKVVSEWVLGIELPASTAVGPGLKIEHGFGLVVHRATVLGTGCVLKHGVTLGMRGGHGERGAPVLGDGVVVGPGAQVLGPVSVGAGARVGAGSIVLADVPPGRVVVGNPARLLPPTVERAPAAPAS